MRLLFTGLFNLLLAALSLLGLPFRLLRRRRRSEYVQFRLKGDPPYRRQLSLSRRLFGRKERSSVASLEELREQLLDVAAEPDVKGVLFLFDELTAPPAKRDVLAGLFDEVRRAGKEVVAHALSASNGECELLFAADRVAVSPGGRLELTGFAAEAMALGAALERIGVQAHFVRRGDYKTAPELFTHAQVSDIQRLTIEGFLDEQYARLVDAVSRGRKKTQDEARALIDAGPYSAQRALAAGLCDARVSEVELAAWLGLPKGAQGVARTEEEEKRARPADRRRLTTYAGLDSARLWPRRRYRRLRRRARVGVVAVNGMIVSGDGGVSVGRRAAGSDAVVRALRAAGRDRRARGVVLHVSSPGGSSLASEQILEEVQRLARKKPVVAYFDRVAASGGYMVALGAREIWTDRSAITGSIGVFGGKFELSGLFSKLGVQRTLLTRGKNAGLASSTRGFTADERAAMEAEVEETYQVFLGEVAKARKMTVPQVHALAEGRVYSGQRALGVGLVDKVGGFEEACRRALELAGRTPRAFDLALYQRQAAPLSLSSLLRSATGARLYSLWMPLWNFSGLDLR